MYPIVIVLLLAVFVAGGVEAKVYKWVMPDGSVEYSDSPQQEGAKAVDLPPLQIYSAPPAPPPGQGEEDAADTAEGYDKVAVLSPEPDEVIRDNGAGTVSVQLQLEPALRRGHTVEILLDGKPIGSGRATSASVTNVDRGTHIVSAVVKDADGKALARADDVTFVLKKTSKLLPARPQPLPRPSNRAPQSRGGAS